MSDDVNLGRQEFIGWLIGATWIAQDDDGSDLYRCNDCGEVRRVRITEASVDFAVPGAWLPQEHVEIPAVISKAFEGDDDALTP